MLYYHVFNWHRPTYSIGIDPRIQSRELVFNQSRITMYSIDIDPRIQLAFHRIDALLPRLIERGSTHFHFTRERGSMSVERVLQNLIQLLEFTKRTTL